MTETGRDWFGMRERGSNPRTEALGGVTTFLTMAYIIVVNPAILAAAGIPKGPGTVATILAAALGCVLMGLHANRPIGVAPYMGENAFIAFGLTALGFTWQQCLGGVFVSGVALALFTVAGLRAWLAQAMPPSLKNAFAAGIGLFLAYIGLYESGIVASAVTGLPVAAVAGDAAGLVAAPPSPVKIGDLRAPEALLTVGGVAVMAVLLHLRVRGALLIGMALTAGAGLLAGVGRMPDGVLSVPFTGEYQLGPVLLKADIMGIWTPAFAPVLFTLFLMVFLDTLGTLSGLGAAAGILDEKGNFPEIQKPMLVDAVATAAGALLGTSTSGAYIESATGIREGARTGLAALVTGGLFLVSLFFLPLLEPLQSMRHVYAPALVVVGVLMLERMRAVAFEDWTEAVPAAASMLMMALTWNIANGLAAGLVLHPLLKVATGAGRELHPAALVMGALCGLYFAVGLVH